MKFINNTLYIEFQEAIDAGISDQTIRKAKLRQSQGWSFKDDPSDKRRVLIAYEPLKPHYKALIVAKYGNPYTFAGQFHISNHVKTDHSALETLANYRFETGKGLSTDHLNELSKACDLLNFLSNCGKTEVKALGFDAMPSFYTAVITYISQEKLPLPTSYSRLREAVREYSIAGAQSVISGKFGNQNNRKVKDEVSLALLKELIAHPHRFGDALVCLKYNQWASENNRTPISEATVGNYRRTYDKELSLSIEGTAEWRNKFDRVVHRMRPSAPLLLINSDDNHLDLFFRSSKTDYYRPVLYIVLDAYNDYVLGYAIGDLVTKELIKEAYRNAANHVRELTGSNYLWHQIVTDRWGLDVKQEGELATFFKQQAKFTPAKYKNSRNKVIEQAFGNNWHNILKRFSGYSGHNITADKKINREHLELTKANWHTIEEMHQVVADFIYALRHLKEEKSKPSRQEVWLKAWNATAEESKRMISKEQHLRYFGITHNRTTTITNRGIEFTVKGYQHIYDVNDEDYARFVGMTGQVIYDPADTTTILFTADEGRVRITAHEFEKVPMALADFNEGDRTRLNNLLDRKKTFSQNILNAQQSRKEILQRAQIDSESLLQAGVLRKEVRVAAERRMIQGNNNDEAFDADSFLREQM